MYKNCKLFILLFGLAFSLNSCFDNEGSQTTPMMMFGHLYVNPQFVEDSIVGAKDTLHDYYSEIDGQRYVDTMQLGDTAMFNALFSSNMNNLVNITAMYDTTRINLWFGVDMDDADTKKALAAGSKPECGILNFNPMYNVVSFPIYIVPKEVGKYPIKITVVSDSKYSTNSTLFYMPIK